MCYCLTEMRSNLGFTFRCIEWRTWEQALLIALLVNVVSLPILSPKEMARGAEDRLCIPERSTNCRLWVMKLLLVCEQRTINSIITAPHVCKHPQTQLPRDKP